MPYDINVFVLGQKKPSKFPFLSNIKYDLNVPKYDSWQFIYQLEGVGYYLGKEDDGLFNAKPLCDSNFEIDESKLPIPHWVKNEEISYHLTPLVVKENYRNELKGILKFFINESPLKMIMFFADIKVVIKKSFKALYQLANFLIY